ncbi:MAG: glycerate kinase [Actinomycetes bacterium]
MRVLIAPDSFGGTLTAGQAAAAIVEGWRRWAPRDDLLLCPLSDGSAGFVDVVSGAVGGQLVSITVPGPLGAPTPATVVVVVDAARGGDGPGCAYVEAAQACGLHLLDEAARNPVAATSTGVGPLLKAALEAGARRIVVGLGGSASMDAGAGCLAALGAGDPATLASGGGALADIPDDALAGLPEVRHRFADVDLVVATEETVPLLGFKGAAASFGVSKGATAQQAQQLDRALGRFAQVALATLGPETAPQKLLATPGAGADGGLGFALSLLGARLVPGADAVLDAVAFSARLAGCDLVVTGEGCFDWRSLRGGVVASVAQRALAVGIPAVVLAGRVEVGRRETVAMGVESAYAVAERPQDVGATLADPAGTLAVRAERIARTWSR